MAGLREIWAHRIPVARSPGGALRRREAGDERNAVQDELGGPGGGAPGARGYRGLPLSGPLSAGGITKSGEVNRTGVPS